MLRAARLPPPGHVLAAACLTELALAVARRALPEIRVDIATRRWADGDVGGGSGARRSRRGRASRAAAAPGCRPGPAPADRPSLDGRAAAAHTRARQDRRRIGRGTDRRRVARSARGQLLKYLVAERRRAVAVDEIGESIWSGADYAVGASVRYYVHALRRRLEPQRGAREPSAFIASGSGTYRLRARPRRGRRRRVRGPRRRRAARASMATRRPPRWSSSAAWRSIAATSSPTCRMPNGRWPSATACTIWPASALRRLADITARARLIDGAARCLERLATLQPFDEDVHRRLMELDIMQGRRSDAVRRYAALRSQAATNVRARPGIHAGGPRTSAAVTPPPLALRNRSATRPKIGFFGPSDVPLLKLRSCDRESSR